MTDRREHFPDTSYTFVIDALAQRDSAGLNRYIMSVYNEPLQAYFSATSFRSLGEPHDLVAGYFASRLSNPNWLQDWRTARESDGIRLSRWLVNGLNFFLLETHRAQKRGQADCIVAYNAGQGDFSNGSLEAAKAYEKAHARALVGEALERTKQWSAANGQDGHFDIFMRHIIEQVPYEIIGAQTGLTISACAGRTRTASGRFRQMLAEVLLEDGADPQNLPQEIARLIDAVRT